jgi:hypothetical protein
MADSSATRAAATLEANTIALTTSGVAAATSMLDSISFSSTLTLTAHNTSHTNQNSFSALESSLSKVTAKGHARDAREHCCHGDKLRLTQICQVHEAL